MKYLRCMVPLPPIMHFFQIFNPTSNTAVKITTATAIKIATTIAPYITLSYPHLSLPAFPQLIPG